MPVGRRAFFGLTTARLVIEGEDRPIPEGNYAAAVYPAMMIQIALEYNSAPDVRGLTSSELRFFYDGIRGGLKRQWRDASK